MAPINRLKESPEFIVQQITYHWWPVPLMATIWIFSLSIPNNHFLTAWMNVWLYVHGAIWWTDISSRVYSCLMPSLLGIGSGSTMTLTRLKGLLKVHEWVYFKRMLLIVHWLVILPNTCQRILRMLCLQRCERDSSGLTITSSSTLVLAKPKTWSYPRTQTLLKVAF